MINPAMLNGYKLVSDPNMTETHAVKRTVRERWLTWPWRPWVRMRAESRPAMVAYLYNNDTLVAHPTVVNALRHSLEAKQGPESFVAGMRQTSAMKSNSWVQQDTPSCESFADFMARANKGGPFA